MFDLVDDVARYPEFMPWCANAGVEKQDANVAIATLHINFRGISQSFTTKNVRERPTQLQIALVQGPFRSLEGRWRFIALSAHACRIELCLNYEFSSRILGKVVGPVFQYIAGSLVDAFVHRAHDCYGTERR